MKVTDIMITKDWGMRPTNETIINGMVWCDVKKGERYDLVQFKIDGTYGYWWCRSLAMPVGTSEETARDFAQQFADTITDDEVNAYKEFIAFGEKYGWD